MLGRKLGWVVWLTHRRGARSKPWELVSLTEKLPPDLLESVGARRRPKTARKLKTCAVCGQSYDLNNLAESFHHDPDPHEPLKAT